MEPGPSHEGLEIPIRIQVDTPRAAVDLDGGNRGSCAVRLSYKIIEEYSSREYERAFPMLTKNLRPKLYISQGVFSTFQMDPMSEKGHSSGFELGKVVQVLLPPHVRTKF